MEKHCSTISFWLKKRTDRNGKSPITMVIAANRERAEFQTGKKIELENWDNAKQQAKSKTAEAKLLNAYLNQLRNKVYLKEIELMQRGVLITDTVRIKKIIVLIVRFICYLCHVMKVEVMFLFALQIQQNFLISTIAIFYTLIPGVI